MKTGFIGLLSALLLCGCSTTIVAPDPSILRVGVTPDSPPMIFKAGGMITGVEAGFAELLGRELGRKVVFVEVPWEKQIDSIEQNKIDIVMSGMTMTPARSMRVNFTNPYLYSGQTCLFRRDAYNPSGLALSMARNQRKGIGYVKDTSGELFVLDRFPAFDKKSFSSAQAAAAALKKGKISMLVHDAPMLWYLFAQNESELVAFRDVITSEPIAWAVRKNDIKLLDEVNALLVKWNKDGSREQIISSWLPGDDQ
jgi:polar amino acid transport system substrate-binding protein